MNNTDLEQIFRLFRARILLAVLILMSAIPVRAAEVDDITPDQPEPVYASLLVASPGEKIYQVTGHAAIRLQCPAYDLDNVFSYETNSLDFLKQTLGGARGRYTRLTIDDYLDQYRAENRSVKQLPLNLSDSQIRHLWQMLDQATESQIEGNFNIRHENCNSKALEMIIAALGSDRIVITDDTFTRRDNGDMARWWTKDDRPWDGILIATALGAQADDRDPWTTRLFPSMMEQCLSTAQIVSADGSSRPLLSARPVELLSGDPISETAPRPLTVALAVLLLSAVISGLDLAGKARRLVHIADVAALVLQSCIAILLIVILAMPSSISGLWNWLFIPFNPFPAIVWIAARRKQLCRRFFIVYGAICAAFVAAPLFTSEIDAFWAIISASIALRVITHYLIPKPIKTYT